MAQLTTAASNFNQTVVTLVQRRLEEELRAPLPFLADALPSQFIPGTNRMRYIRYADIGSTVTLPPSPGTPPFLTEGVAPTTVGLTIGYDDFPAYQAGVVINISDVALTQSPHDLIAVAADRGMFDAKRTIDRYIAATIDAGTNLLGLNGHNTVATTAAGDVMTGKQVKTAVSKLRTLSVPTFGDGYFHAIIHPRVEFDIETDTALAGWLSANTYVDNTPLMTGEIGRLAGVRFTVSAEAVVHTGGGAAGVDVVDSYLYGPDAYAFGDMQTMRATFVRGAEKSDPLDQQALIGWKAMFGSALLVAAGNRYITLLSSPSV